MSPLARTRAARLLLVSLLAGALFGTGAASSAQAAVNGSISGNIAGAGSPNVPIDGASVLLYSADSLSIYASTGTDASGNFSFTDVVPGHYTYWVYVEGSVYAQQQWFSGKSSAATADYFTLASNGAITGKNTVLAKNATVSGTVTGPTSTPLEGISVIAYAPLSGNSAFDTTDALGHYTLVGLAADSYTLEFGRDLSEFELGPSPYLQEWWNNKTSLESADQFTVVSGETVTGKNAQLAAAGAISGHVGSGSADLQDILVTAYDATSGDWVWDTFTDEDGNYIVGHLRAGSYTLQFSSYNGQHVTEWWNNAASQAAATPIAVASGATVTGRDVVLADGPTANASISGHVYGDAGDLEGMQVEFQNAQGIAVAGTATDPLGNYTISSLPPGTYTIVVSDPSQLYFGEAIVGVTVASGQTVSGQDLFLTKSSTISGTVTSSNTGAALPNVSVIAYSSDPAVDGLDAIFAQTYSDESGNYTLDGLFTGNYKIGFSASSSGYDWSTGTLASSSAYASQWFGSAYSFGTASGVNVASLATNVVDIDADLVYPTFADVSDPSSAFFPYIEWMYTSNISTGTAGPGKPAYLPGNSVSRQAMAQFLYRLSGDTFTPPGTATFADVAVGSQFFTAIEWMAAEGISTGTAQPSGLPLYKPTDAVSRSAMALFLSRYDGVTLATPTEQSFADVPVSASSAAAIGWMKDVGISTGTAQPSGLPLYKPSDPVSRQAMAAFLYRLDHLAP